MKKCTGGVHFVEEISIEKGCGGGNRKSKRGIVKAAFCMHKRDSIFPSINGYKVFWWAGLLLHLIRERNS
jgi:hypothetical protein